MCCLSSWDLYLLNYLHAGCCLFLFAVLIFKNCALQLDVSICRAQLFTLLAVLLLSTTGIIFLFAKLKLCPHFGFFSAMTRNDFATAVILGIWVLCTRNIQTRIVFLPCGIGVGWAASALVSSARLHELREIQDVTWRVITAFSWQSDFDSLWAEFGSQTITALRLNMCLEAAEKKPWRCIFVGYGNLLEKSGRCAFIICFHCGTFENFKAYRLVE